MVELTVSRRAAVFSSGDADIGTYVLDDPFKPYLHPIRTPAGHTVSLAMPHDHRHHKGLMYALATENVNFWEEIGDEKHPRIGRQLQTGIDFDFSPDKPGLTQQLSWVDDHGDPIFNETRVIACELTADKIIRWTWNTNIKVLHATRLRISPWAIPDTAGRLINYHGLGMRFARSVVRHAEHMEIVTDKGTATIPEVHGACIPRVGITAAIDGYWNFPRVHVSIRQLTTNDAFFVLSYDFTSVSIGPTTLGPVDLAVGDTLSGIYEIEVYDLPSA